MALKIIMPSAVTLATNSLVKTRYFLEWNAITSQYIHRCRKNITTKTSLFVQLMEHLNSQWLCSCHFVRKWSVLSSKHMLLFGTHMCPQQQEHAVVQNTNGVSTIASRCCCVVHINNMSSATGTHCCVEHQWFVLSNRHILSRRTHNWCVLSSSMLMHSTHNWCVLSSSMLM